MSDIIMTEDEAREIKEIVDAEERWGEYFNEVNTSERRRLGVSMAENPFSGSPAAEAENLAWKKSGVYWREVEEPKLKDNYQYKNKKNPDSLWKRLWAQGVEKRQLREKQEQQEYKYLPFSYNVKNEYE